MEKTFADVVARIRQEDPRYGRGAYFFLREALDHTLKQREDQQEGRRTRRHVSGQELLEGIRTYALDQYGPMAKTVFDHWNVKESLDFGRIVFQLVEYGIFGRTDEDCLEDFESGYDFAEAFEKPFLPENPAGIAGARTVLKNRGG